MYQSASSPTLVLFYQFRVTSSVISIHTFQYCCYAVNSLLMNQALSSYPLPAGVPIGKRNYTFYKFEKTFLWKNSGYNHVVLYNYGCYRLALVFHPFKKKKFESSLYERSCLYRPCISVEPA